MAVELVAADIDRLQKHEENRICMALALTTMKMKKVSVAYMKQITMKERTIITVQLGKMCRKYHFVSSARGTPGNGSKTKPQASVKYWFQ